MSLRLSWRSLKTGLRSISLFNFLLILFFSVLPLCTEELHEPDIFAGRADLSPVDLRTIMPGVHPPVVSRSRNPKNVSAILIHSTDKLSARSYIKQALEGGWMVHFVIAKSGRLFGIRNPGSQEFTAAPEMDPVAIHIALEGSPDSSRWNAKEMATLRRLVLFLSTTYNIPMKNYDIDSKRGVFSHTHAKMRYGHFVNLYPCGGEKVVQYLLESLGGVYWKEAEWKDRYGPGWILVRDTPEAIQQRPAPDRGRGLTPSPVAELKSVERMADGRLPEKFRLRYAHRGNISPSCVVLHYTGTKTMMKSMETLELRRLGSQLIINHDGRAYQVMDTLEEKAAAAAGTNSHCVQIEIVGRGTEDLLRDRPQVEKVVQVLKELSEKYNFPLNNLNIQSYRGVFSHSQAKKRWGRSIIMAGHDFDPGKEYMQMILPRAGGVYYPEEKWYDRDSRDWTILTGDFQP